MTRQEEKQMKRIAKFHKVSKERFTADWIDTFAQSQEEAEKVVIISIQITKATFFQRSQMIPMKTKL